MEQAAGGPNALIGKELRITGSVLDWFYNTTSVGFQSAVVIDEDVEIKFLGGSVWSFKPDVPFQIYVSVFTYTYMQVRYCWTLNIASGKCL